VRFRSPSRIVGALLGAVLCGPSRPAAAQPASNAAAATLAQAVIAYRGRDYVRSGPLFLAAASGAEDPAGALYNAACSFALAGQAEPAFAALARAVDAGWADSAHAARDADLTSLRGDARWQPLLGRAAARAKADGEFWDGPALRAPYRADLDPDEKVAGLSKLWAEAKFNFVHFGQTSGLNWDSLYLATLPRVRATTSTREYYRVLQAFYARLGDGHTGVSMPPALAAATAARPLVRTRLVEGRVVVVAADAGLAAAGVVPGVEVVAVDGTPVAAYAAREVAPYVSASTPHDRDARVYGPALLRGAEGAPVALTLRDARGRTWESRLPRVRADAYARAFASEPMTLRVLPGGVAHVALNTFIGSEAPTGSWPHCPSSRGRGRSSSTCARTTAATATRATACWPRSPTARSPRPAGPRASTGRPSGRGGGGRVGTWRRPTP
jgi:hypothetical protein